MCRLLTLIMLLREAFTFIGSFEAPVLVTKNVGKVWQPRAVIIAPLLTSIDGLDASYYRHL